MKNLIPLTFLSLFLFSTAGFAQSQGNVSAWGLDNYGVVSGAPLDGDYVDIALSGFSGHALLSNGSIVSWGYDRDGVVSETPVGNDFSDIAGGWDYCIGLRTDGSLRHWGNSDYGLSSPPAGNDFISVSAIMHYAYALKTDGTIAGWGHSTGDFDPPSGSGFVEVFGRPASQFAVALKDDGSLVAWGKDSHDVVSSAPSGPDFLHAAVGVDHGVAVRTDGTLVSWGKEYWGTILDTPTGNDFVSVVAGKDFSLALKVDGTIVGWGYDYYGTYGNAPQNPGFSQLVAAQHVAIAIGPAPIGEISVLPSQLSTASGGIIQFGLDFNWRFSGFPYLILGSAQGSSSGFTLGDLHVPLGYDWLTAVTLQQQYSPLMVNFSGSLDAQGNALGLGVIPPGRMTRFIGTTFSWAAVAISPAGIPAGVTNAGSVTIVP